MSPQDPKQPKENVSASVTALSYALLTRSLDQAKGKDVFLSPLSIYNALSLALNAAAPGSDTHKELLHLLCPGAPQAHASTYLSYFKSFFTGGSSAELKEEKQLNTELSKLVGQLAAATSSDTSNEQGCTLLLANGLFVKTHLKADYVKHMDTLFGAKVEQGADAAAVNAWVDKQTRGEINELLPPGSQFDTILANALYFKGLWHNAFKPQLTRPRVFHAPSGDRQVHTMVATYEGDKATQVVKVKGKYTAVMLPYKGLQYAAVAVLPDPGVPLADALAAMRDGSGAGGAAPSVDTPHSTTVIMPRFRAESGLELKPLLHALGVKAAFGEGADFGRAGDGLFVEKVVHKAVVDVDEHGTVAAAATAVAMNKSLPQPPVEVVFDRPFVFSIQHIATGTPVFYGVVQEPPEAS